MKKPLSPLIRSYFASRNKGIQHWITNAVSYQQNIFDYLVYVGQKTVWGQTYAYDKIKNTKHYAQAVPIQSYETLQPFIDKVLLGEQNVLWHTPIRWFAKSSGTTSDKSKFIPISTASFHKNHYLGARDILSLYCIANPNTRIFEGKGLIIGGSHQINQLNKAVSYGDLSAVLAQNMPAMGHYMRTPDLATTLLPNWDKKLERIVQITKSQNVTQMAGVPTWTLIVLKRLLAETGKDNVADVWQNLELYLHGGVSFTPYEQQFKQLIRSDKMQYWQTYNASEGFFAIQDQAYRNDMVLLANHGIYYEFMPMSELGAEHPRVLQLHEVEVGQNYALIISTFSGLWRYMVGDTVQFTTLAPYRIRVTGRTKHYINAFGEEVIVDNADAALAAACAKHHATVLDYTAAPIYFGDTHNGGHEWLIEFEQLPNNLAAFATDLDQELQNRNSDYEAKRYKNMAMQAAVVRAVPQGTFYRWLQSKGKLGGQNKVPRLSNTREYLDAIIEFTIGN